VKNVRPRNVIGCCVCLNLTGERVEAAVVVAGYSVCESHAQLAAQPGFSIFNLERRNVNPV
jgi:hypothetical protein